DTVVVNIPDFAILSKAVSNYKAAMSKFCPSANVSELDIALADIANGPTTITSYARAHPSVHYVAPTTDGLAAGLPGALKAAGLTSLKIVGQGATPTTIQYLHSGQQAADTAFPFYEAMYSMVNAVVQKVAGLPIT